VAYDGSLGARIRPARRVPYLAVIGAREAAAGEVALRLRDGSELPPRPDALAYLLDACAPPPINEPALVG
jgi:threonyl-tRNA synthetase